MTIRTHAGTTVRLHRDRRAVLLEINEHTRATLDRDNLEALIQEAEHALASLPKETIGERIAKLPPGTRFSITSDAGSNNQYVRLTGDQYMTVDRLARVHSHAALSTSGWSKSDWGLTLKVIN